MISTIFNKIIKGEKGGIEFIESSVVYPFMLLFITLLLLISILTVKRSISFESSYIYSREILNNKKNTKYNKEEFNELSSNQDKLNERLNKYDTNLNSDISEKFFTYNIKTFNKNDIYIKSLDYDQTKIINNINFIKYVYNDLDMGENLDINNMFSNLKKRSIDLMKKFKK